MFGRRRAALGTDLPGRLSGFGALTGVVFRPQGDRGLVAKAASAALYGRTDLLVLIPRPVTLRAAIYMAGFDPDETEHEAIMSNRSRLREILAAAAPGLRYSVIEIGRPVLPSAICAAEEHGCSRLLLPQRLFIGARRRNSRTDLEFVTAAA